MMADSRCLIERGLSFGPGWASSSTRWGFTLCQQLPGLASFHSTDHHLLVGVGLLLLQVWWQCQ
jgi:hypothetical protein